ncbi:pseudouridine synthase [Paramuribaculum intestinale]|uniref:pseudouridine synthase n=2 Tax=Paramuribaculum intestinale TaxID=2094151 RepID=UPI0025B6CC8F|nr:pseudouridine synthase [Paramuribaculum intestinale]
MDNSNDKKTKRPRIGESRPAAGDMPTEQRNSYTTTDSTSDQTAPDYHQGGTGYRPRQQGGYQPRYNQGGYQPRYNNQSGYRQQGGYQPRYNQGGYHNRYNAPEGEASADTTGAAGENNTEQPNTGYRPRYQQGGYQPRHTGYQPRQQGGYRQQQGGYQNQRPQRHNQFGMPRGGKSFVPRPKRVEYEMPLPDPDEQIRLNKFMANAGICSRREADEFIQQGLVKVNGNVVTELGTKITHSDTVEYDGKVVTLEHKCYILLNKPKDCVTTSDDPNGRLTVMDIVKGACEERIYPVGRLDRNTTGVLLLTNDGDLASKLTHPKYVKKKIYHVWTDKDISEDDMQRIADGIELDDGPIHADAISYATETDRNQAGIEIHSGRNRIVRRIFESLGYHVTKLDRVYFAGLTKKNLPRGRWRYLTQEEVNFLKMGSFE